MAHRSRKQTDDHTRLAGGSVSGLPTDMPQWTAGQPLYRELKRQIADALHKGLWNPGEAIPSETQLKKHYGVSIGTVRKAVDELVAENILVRQQGRGTFVVTHDSYRYFFTFFRIATQEGRREIPSVELLQFSSRRADVGIARALGIGVSERIWCFTNRLSLQGRSALIDKIIVPAELFPGLGREQLNERKGTIYSFYQQHFGINVVRTQERLRAIRAAHPYSAWLGVEPGYPLLRVARIAFTYRDRAVELRESLVNCAAHEYSAEPLYGKGI